MALTITTTAQEQLDSKIVEPTILMEIDGVSTIFSSVTIGEFIKYGDAGADYGDDDFRYGRIKPIDDQSVYMTFGTPRSATTTAVSQAMYQDKGGTSSITTFKVELIDKNNEITDLITPGNQITDILGAKATIYMGINPEQTGYPEDFFRIFVGVIDDVESGAGNIIFKISHPEKLKRSEIFIKHTTALSSGIDNAVTTISLDNTTGLLTPADILSTFVRINDEIIQYTGVTTTTITGCTRGSMGTTAAAHDSGDTAESVYQLDGGALDIALKLMLSGKASPWKTGVTVTSFQIGDFDVASKANSIYLSSIDAEDKFGIVVGDTITTTGATNGANNVSDKAITAIEKTQGGTFITLGSVTFVDEINTSAVLSIKTKYNTLPAGFAMDPELVDVVNHEELSNIWASSIASDYSFRIDDTITGTFLDEEVYFPSGLYQIPRTRCAVGITAPPLPTSEVKELNSANITNPSKIVIKRSINRLFYNSILYQYDYNIIDGKFKAGALLTSAQSTAQVSGVGTKLLKIQSQGLRSGTSAESLITSISNRYLDRYKFGAESLRCTPLFSEAIGIEIGDVVKFGDTDLQISDIKNGTRAFEARLFEVTNKKLNITSGTVELQLIDTAFDVTTRHGLVSQSSYADSGSTSTRIKLQNSFGTASYELETTKWTNFVGETLVVRSADFATSQEFVLSEIASDEDNVLVASAALSPTPSSGDIIELPIYTSASSVVTTSYAFASPTVDVVSGASGTVFDVGAGDVSKFWVGGLVVIHKTDWSTIGAEGLVSDITGTTITVDTDIGFTPDNTYDVSLIGFSSDSTQSYKLL